MMEIEKTLIDFNSYRQQKQLQAEHNAASLFSLATDYSIRYSNIREKVRAKHLFRGQIHYSDELPLPKYLEDIFQQWFLFDYHTIQGETMFSLFLKQHSTKLSEPELVLGALFLATYLEPFKMVEINNEKRCFIVKEIVEEENQYTIIKTSNVFDLKKGEYVFLRRLPLLNKDWAIGSVFPIETKELIDQLVDTYKQIKLVNPSLTWRTYLKRKGYFLVANFRS
jgi:hypothetical protein